MFHRNLLSHGPLERYVKLRVAHAPRIPGTFPPPPRFSDPDMYHDTCVTHVPWCMSGSLASCFLWSRWWGTRSRHSRRMRNRRFYVSGERPMGTHEKHRDEAWLLYTPGIREISPRFHEIFGQHLSTKRKIGPGKGNRIRTDLISLIYIHTCIIILQW